MRLKTECQAGSRLSLHLSLFPPHAVGLSGLLSSSSPTGPPVAVVHLHQVLALLHHLSLGCTEALAAAQEIAIIHGCRCPVAQVARSAKGPTPGLPVTGVWAGQQINQVMICVRLETIALGHQQLAGTHSLGVNLYYSLKTSPPGRSPTCRRGHDLSACAHLTGHAMALALHLHV